MSRPRFVIAMAASLWSITVTCSQPAPANALSAELRAHVTNDRYDIVTSIRGLPLGVRDGLQELFGSQTLDIAEPGAGFELKDAAVDPKSPLRRLAVAGCSTDHCIVYYERGGTAHTWHVALFHWVPEATRFEWGGLAPPNLKSVDDVRNAILSGAAGAKGAW